MDDLREKLSKTSSNIDSIPESTDTAAPCQFTADGQESLSTNDTEMEGEPQAVDGSLKAIMKATRHWKIRRVGPPFPQARQQGDAVRKRPVPILLTEGQLLTVNMTATMRALI
ncbi:unnamed protein product [Amaranthus hypochondriacus]